MMTPKTEAERPDSAERDFLKSLIENSAGIEGDKKFGKFSVEKAFAQMKKQASFARVHSKWLEGRKKGFEKIKQWDASIPQEISEGFENIKGDLEAAGLFKNPYIGHQAVKIQQILQGDEKDKSRFALACMEIGSLLGIMLSFEAEKIVEKYAKLKVSPFSEVDVFTGRRKLAPKYIDRLFFAPSFQKKESFMRIFHQSEIKSICVSLEILYILERHWLDEKFDPDLHKYWDEIKRAKEGEAGSLIFFNRNKIMSCLETVVQEMLYGEDISFDQSKDMSDCILELYLSDLGSGSKLFLDVSGDFTTTTYVIHRFKNKKFAPFGVTEKLFNKGRANVTKNTNFNGVSNFRQRIELDNILGDVFFECDGSCMQLKYHYVACNSLSLAECKKLREHLKELEAKGRKKQQ